MGFSRLRPRRAEPSETDRSEGFSDGVFAVAITLLALDLGRVHAQSGVGDGTLLAALGLFWPTLLAFAASLAFIGVAWTNHHNVFVRVARMSRGLKAANLLLLAGITMVPWATSTLAEALSQHQDSGHGVPTLRRPDGLTCMFAIRVAARTPGVRHK